MASRPHSRASLTIPNLITLARILLTPLFIILFIQGQYRKGLIVFILAGLSDLADGLVARVWQGLEAEVSRLRVPLGIPVRTAPDFSALTAREKIQQAIGGK